MEETRPARVHLMTADGLRCGKPVTVGITTTVNVPEVSCGLCLAALRRDRSRELRLTPLRWVEGKSNA